MNKIIACFCSRILGIVKPSFGMAGLLLLFAIIANAQTTSATDGTTPNGLTPGSPAGAYALNEFDTINPYNGNLNFHLPLLQVGGRGEARMTMMLGLNTKSWRVKHTTATIGGELVESFSPEPNSWAPTYTGYGPGALYGRKTGTGNFTCSGLKRYTTTLTRLTFITPDGTEYELRDQASGGQPAQVSSCSAPPNSRGTIFVTADGTSATFISDTAIADDYVPSASGVMAFAPYGILMMGNGSQYRIDNGLVSWIKDRNGNKLNFLYDTSGQVTSITDSLNRVVTIQYMVSDPVYGTVDQITCNGFNGAQRIVRVARYGPLANVLRPGAGYSIKTYGQLFPELNGSQSTPFNPLEVSAVYLPDGRRYQFYYNEYGELERVTLPTGGAIEYRMMSGSGVYPTVPDAGDYQIYRRVTERQVYADGTNLESKMVYNATYSQPGDAEPWSTTVTIDQYDSTGTQPITRGKHYYYGSGFASLFQSVGYYFYPAWDEGREYKTELFDNAGATLFRRVNNTIQQRASVPWWSAYASLHGLNSAHEPSLDVRLTDAVTTLFDVTPHLVSEQKHSYDQYNNQIAEEEFDYGLGSPPTFPTRRTETDYVTIGESNAIDYTDTSVHLLSLVKELRVYSVNSSNGTLTQAANTHFYYDQTPLTPRTGIVGWEAPATAARGNLTSTTRWLDTGSPITTTQQYDIAGQVVQTTDALGNTSLVEYANSFNTYAFATTMRTPVPDSTGQYGSNARLVTQYDYDFSTGLLKTITDVNSQVTTALYNDPLDRLTNVIFPAGGGQVTYSYGDTVGNLYLRTQRTQDASTTLESYLYFDGLGRTYRSSQSEGIGSIFIDTKFDALGRVSQVSNPYRTGDTLLWTLTQYDGLSRVKVVTLPGGAQMTNNYSGNGVTVSDPAGKARTSVSDALGRVTQIFEDPGTAPHLNYQTNYTFDALNNLRKIAQGPVGSQQLRYFMYDSLKRLIRTRIPEQDVNNTLPAATDSVTGNSQWSQIYSYDDNNNLLSKVDPRNITSSYTYDALKRMTSRSYMGDPNQTPTVNNKYDGVGTTAQNALGKLTSVSATSASGFASTTTYDNFDVMGRVLRSTQTTEGQAYTVDYQYDLVGHLIWEKYPSGRIVTTTCDQAGRLNDVSSNATHYASQLSYSAHGKVTDMKLGNDLWEHTTYEPNRLQPTEIDLGTAQGGTDKLKLTYDYGALTANNGNIQNQTITIPGGPMLTESYTYDGVDRLLVAQENNGTNWKQTFTYDRFGNRGFDANNTTANVLGPNPTIDQLTNRFAAGQGYAYDAAGNLTANAGGHTFSYDAENMQVRCDNTAGQYFYDGSQQRVETRANGVTTIFVYDAMGKLLAEYASSNPTGNGTSYLTADALGSPRVITGTNTSSIVRARHDYLPFGEEISAGVGGRTAGQGYVPDTVRQKFTGQQRDTESGLDYFEARYYSSATGRFTSPDSVGGTHINPQTLNLYAYVMNNPVASVDPTGHVAANPENASFRTLGDWAANEEEADRNEQPTEVIESCVDPNAGMAPAPATVTAYQGGPLEAAGTVAIGAVAAKHLAIAVATAGTIIRVAAEFLPLFSPPTTPLTQGEEMTVAAIGLGEKLGKLDASLSAWAPKAAEDLYKIARELQATQFGKVVVSTALVYNGKSQKFEVWVSVNKGGEVGIWRGHLGQTLEFQGGATGLHAEQAILRHLGKGDILIAGAASFNICSNKCAPELEQKGMQLGGPKEYWNPSKASDPRTDYRRYWRK